MALEHIGIALGRHAKGTEGDDVVDLERIGHRDQLAGPGLQRLRLVVLEQVAGVPKVVLGQQVQGPLGVGQGRSKVAADPLSGRRLDRLDRVLDDGPLLSLVHVVGISRVVDAVGEELPSALDTCLDDFRMMIDQRGGQRDRSPQAIPVHQLHQPPVADPVAPVALGVADYVGGRPGPAGPRDVLRRIVFVGLDIRGDPERQLLATRPDDGRPVDVGPVVVEVGVGRHAGFHRAR